MATEPAHLAATEEDGHYDKAYAYLETLYWGGVIAWAGLVFWADRLDHLPQVGWAGAWSWIFLAAGLYAFFLARVRLSTPDYPDPKVEDCVWAGIWTVLGLKGLIASDIVWPLVLMGIGAAMLAKALLEGPPRR